MDGDCLKVGRRRTVGGALALLLVLCLLNWFAISVYFDGLPATGFAAFTTTRGFAVETDTTGSIRGEDRLMLNIRGFIEFVEARS